MIYVARFAESIYVLHAFQKKTQKTRKEDIELARRRYRQIEESHEATREEIKRQRVH